MFELKLIIMLFGLGPKADFLELDSVLLFLGRFLLLGLLVKIFPVIHDATDRRPDIGGDLYQVQAPAGGYIEGLAGRYDPNLRAVLID